MFAVERVSPGCAVLPGSAALTESLKIQRFATEVSRLLLNRCASLNHGIALVVSLEPERQVEKEVC